MFADRAKIYVRSGKGGDGHVSFRREKYVPSGGPDGGDGGHGGDVIFVVDEGLNTLIDFRHIRKYKAGDGEEGGKKNCRGKDGEDIIIKVPAGTVIKEAQSGQVITDMSGDNKRVVLLKGGKGGNGNQHYATSTMQAPKYAQPGQAAQELELLLKIYVPVQSDQRQTEDFQLPFHDPESESGCGGSGGNRRFRYCGYPRTDRRCFRRRGTGT